jgi:hypothetical protein
MRTNRNPLAMTAARAAAEVQSDPEDNKRKQNERKVREFHARSFNQYGALQSVKQPLFFCHEVNPEERRANASSPEQLPSRRQSFRQPQEKRQASPQCA